eukprot:9188880-Pyramimonas_sp.AAC.1
MQRIIASRPPSMGEPWDLVANADEVVPGNQLSGHGQRKCWVAYMPFMQFGSLLTDEDAWICLACERSDRVKNYGGGVAQVFGALLKMMLNASGHSFDAGAVLNY